MSGLTIYYSDPVKFSGISKIDMGKDNVSSANFIPNYSNIYKSVIYNGVSYSLTSIIFEGQGTGEGNQNKGNIYIKHHLDPSSNKFFYLKIELDSKAPNEPSLDSFIKTSTKEGTINLSALMNTLNGKISSKITVSADKDGNNFMCDLGNLSLLDAAAISTFQTFNTISPDSIVKKINGDKSDVLLTVADAPKKVIQNCKRKSADWGDKDTSENEYIKKTQDSMKISMAFVVVFFVMFFGYIIVHLLNKGEDTDVFGNPLVFDTTMPGMMGGGGGRGNKRTPVSVGGGQCYIPDDIPIKFPEPNVLAFGKFAAFLFFLQTIIYGALVKNDDWIGVSIGSLVLLGIVSAGYRVMYNVGFSDGMTISDLLLFSNTFTLAKYPAMLSYLTFYTSFIRNVNKQYTGKHEIAMFTVNYILLVIWGIMIVKFKVVSRANPLFWGPIVLIFILTATFGGLMGEEEKKKRDHARQDDETAILTQNQISKTDSGNLADNLSGNTFARTP